MPRTRIAVVGLNFGRHIVDQIVKGEAQEFFELAAVCDMDRAKADDFASRFGVKAYYDLDSLLADPSIPAVGLYTGPVGRAKLLSRIIQSGRHVMTTKPFESDPEAAVRVLEEARILGRAIHLNSPSPVPAQDLAQIAQWQEEFQLGRPLACRAEVWVRYAENADGSWYDDPDKCFAAPLLRLGIYLLNDLIHWFGPAESVQVFQSRLFTGRPTVDHAQVGLRYKSGAIGNVFASFCVDDGEYYKNSAILNFERGTVYRNVGPNEQAGHQLELCTRVNNEKIVRRASYEVGSGEYMWNVFADAIHGAGPDMARANAQTVEGVRLLNAIHRSSSTGSVESV